MTRFSRTTSFAVAILALALGAGLASAETTTSAAQAANETAPGKKALKEVESAKHPAKDQRPQHHTAGKDQSATTSPAPGHTPSQQPAVTQ